MSRTLRFRCWDKVAGLYLSNGNWTGINQDGNPWLVIEGKDVLDGSDRWVVEQYTGLKDKNGREIYEGDIVRATYFEAHYRALKVGKKRKITGKIIYGSACFFIESISDETPLLQVGGSENIEVIGNIHENPELLGGE